MGTNLVYLVFSRKVLGEGLEADRFKVKIMGRDIRRQLQIKERHLTDPSEHSPQ